MSPPGQASSPEADLDLAPTVFQQLAERSKITNRARVEEIGRLVAAGAADQERIRNLAHQVVGSAGTFGFDAVSDDARRLEVAFGGEGEGSEPDLTEVVRLLDEMSGALAD